MGFRDRMKCGEVMRELMAWIVGYFLLDMEFVTTWLLLGYYLATILLDAGL